jgi:LysM repeat protein
VGPGADAYHGAMVHASADDARDGAAPATPTTMGSGAGPSATDVCRYLLVPELGIRYARPDRDHRCLAVRPYDTLAQDKQRRICLTADHATCPAFQAARQRRMTMLAESGISPSAVEAGRSRPLSRTAPLVLETGHASFGRSHGATALPPAVAGAVRSAAGPGAGVARGSRLAASGMRGGTAARGWRSLTGPVMALVVVGAALAVIAARLPGSSGQPVAAGSPSAVVSAAASQAVAPSAATSPAANPSITPAPTPVVTPTPTPPPPTTAPSVAPPGTQTYRVKAGDTLTSIAARFGVSVAELQSLNGIKDPRLLQIGQVLRIP